MNPDMAQPDIKRIIGRFAETVQGLQLALNDSLSALQATAAIQKKELTSFVSGRLQPLEQGGKKLFLIEPQANGQSDAFQSSIDSYRSFVTAKKKLESAQSSHRVLPANMLLALVGAYDAYLAALASAFLTVAFEAAGSDVSGHSREDSVQAAIGRLLLCGPDGRLLWFENELGIELRADLAVSGQFLEVFEKRQLLFTGQVIEITPENFAEAHDEIYETGIKLGHLLWRKLLPEQTAKANASFQDLAFNLIQAQQLKLASNLLSFANTVLRKYADENNRLVFLVNGALAAYLGKNKEECARMLGQEDWSAKHDIFRLPHLVLTEQFAEAAAVMRRIGKDSRPTRGEYLRWPLFAEFRKSAEFGAAFKDLFEDVLLTENEATLAFSG
ncbi:MAG TPA: hypothetical protein VKZ53_32095 [Candidatus Angelobacter sp.]|nr:hypothetical protein [Candidatus Angelobacter sp.]